LTSTK
jgi:U3 small nucleolar RNA-associated protein 14